MGAGVTGMHGDARVDFFVAGVQKGGTSALDKMLRGHPLVQMARRKEVHFFDDDTMDWSSPDYTRLHDYYDWSVPGVLRGEATPKYLYWPASMERLAAYHPGAKVIVCLRHPAHRAFSHWRMEVKRSAETLPFSGAIRAGRLRVCDSPGGVHGVFSYVERGFYATQIRRLFALVPERQVHFLRTDHLYARPEAEIARLLRFLGLPDAPIATKDYVVPVNSSGMAPMAQADLEYLCALYAEEIAALQGLIPLDVQDWTDPAYREPMVEAQRFAP